MRRFVQTTYVPVELHLYHRREGPFASRGGSARR